MEFRALQPSDANEWHALRLRGLLEEPTAFASSHEEEVHTSAAEIARRLQPSELSTVFGAFVCGRLVGMVGVQREAMRKLSHKAFVWGLYVEPEHRRAGHASRLLRQALSFAWGPLAVSQVNLSVDTENGGAIALYRRFGFSAWGTERRSAIVNDKPHDEYHMVCYATSAP
jgi:RimJ/RimL family protein N-acetyltransferase